MLNIADLNFSNPRATFFDTRAGDVHTLLPGDVGILGIPSDSTHSSRIGARFAPRALRHTTRDLIRGYRQGAELGLYDARSGRQVSLRNTTNVVDVGDVPIDPLDVMKITRAIADMTGAIVRNGALPVAIGGDHYNGYPACLGVSEALAERRPGSRIGYIQIDGHLDFGDRLGAWGHLNHATNARRVSELPNIARANMVWIGIAGWVDGKDVAEIESVGGLVFSAEDIHRIGAPEVARQAIAHASRGCDTIYLSADIDALDAGFLPGTGSIVHSEVTPAQYLEMLHILATAPLCGMDLVEVSPPLDPSGRSERIAGRLLFEALHPHFLAPSTSPFNE